MATIFEKQFEWLKEYRFPLSLTNNTYAEALKKYFDAYCDNIDGCACFTQEVKDSVRSICNEILNGYLLLQNNDMQQGREKLFNLFTTIKESFLLVDFERRNQYNSLGISKLYRINPMRNDKLYSSVEMLHVPSILPEMISENRFNRKGHPVSYMSTSCFIAWIECKLPGEFQVAKYNISQSGQNRKLIRLDIRPLHFYRNFIKPYGELNELNKLSSFCKFFPVVMACSVWSKKNSTTLEEYWIPQILMEWAESTNSYAGIRYYSVTRETVVRNYEEFNMALIVGKTNENGYSLCLQKDLMAITDPNSICISSCLNTISEDFERIKSWYSELMYQIQTQEHPKLFLKYKAFCETLIENVQVLFNDSNNCASNRYAALVTLDSLEVWIETLRNAEIEECSVSGSCLEHEQREMTTTMKDSFNETILPFAEKMKKYLK